MRLRWIGVAVIAALALAAMQRPASAFTRALLVGVSYVDRPDIRLNGPGNDVALMHAALLARGVAPGAIAVLADQLPAGTQIQRAQPTRAAILAALDRLARESRAGDVVLVMMAGHGSQQPVTPSAAEPDGLDEIFLPSDIGAWDGNVGRVENAIVDDEIGEKLDAIRRTGAFVVALFDTCHSGSMTRGTLAARPRAVAPAALGIPSAGGGTRSLSVPAPQRAVEAPVALGPRGLVAFFAAQADQQTFEIEIAPAGGGPRQVQGPMTYALASVLMEGTGGAWRDIAARVLARYEQVTRMAVSRSDPLVEGDMAAELPGTAAARAGTPAEPVIGAPGRVRIQAGRLQGIEAGMRIPLAASDAPERVIGEAVVGAVGLTDALADLDTRPTGPLPRRLMARLPDAMALPLLRVAADAAVSEAARDRLRHIPGIALVEAGGEADLRLHAEADRLWLLMPGETLADAQARQALAVPLVAPRATEILAAVMARTAAAFRLQSLASELAVAEAAADLRTEIRILRAGPDAARRACPALVAAPPPQAELLPAGQAPRLGHCDVLYLTIRNTGRAPIDLGLFYIHMNGMALVVPDMVAGGDFGTGVRLPPGGTPLTVPLRIVTWDAERGVALPTGPGRVVVLAARRDSMMARAEVLNFAAALGIGGSATGAGLDESAAALLAAVSGQRLRSGADPRRAASVSTIRWQSVP